MSYIYRIAPLELNQYGVPIFPGCHHVSTGVGNMYVVYGPIVNRRCPVWAVIYKDPATSKLLVGATEEIMGLLSGCITLNELTNANPADWGCWLCDTIVTIEDVPTNISGDRLFTLLTPMFLEISSANPLFLIDRVAIGGQATAPFGLGEFQPIELETQTTYLGDHHQEI